MKMSRSAFWLAAFLAGSILAGCSKDDVAGTDDDQGTAPVGVNNETEAMKYYAAQDEFVKNDEATFTDDEMQPTDYGTFGKIDAAITPLRWGRFVSTVTTNITVTVQTGDSLAIAHVEKTIEGTFRVRGINETNDTVMVEKPFTDVSTRNVIFKRVRRDVRRYWLNWLPVASSLVDGGTIPPNNTIDITQLQLFLPNGDTLTITDPNNYYFRYRWTYLFTGGRKDVPELTPNQRVVMQATVVSAHADTDLVALRYGVGTFQKRRMRMTLVSETFDPGTQLYTRIYQTPFLVHAHRGFFTAGVDAVSHETLFDDEAPYAVSWWGVPYRVF